MCEMFNNNDIQQQLKIKKVLDSGSLLNPGKVYPILRKCAEEGRVHVHRGKTKFPDIPRFWFSIISWEREKSLRNYKAKL